MLWFYLPEGVLSPADIFEKANNVSGKFGGVAGVLQGVICKEKKIDNYLKLYPLFNLKNVCQP